MQVCSLPRCAAFSDPKPSPSYIRVSHRLTHPQAAVFYDGRNNTRSTLMNTIIYIVGLIVVIGFVLSFFGLR